MDYKVISIEEAFDFLKEQLETNSNDIIEKLKAFSKSVIHLYLENTSLDELQVSKDVIPIYCKNLIVKGNLIDCYKSDHSLLIVLGSLEAENVITKGEIFINGDVNVTKCIYGDSMGDYSMTVLGNCSCETIIDNSHWFYINKNLKALKIGDGLKDAEFLRDDFEDVFVKSVLDGKGDNKYINGKKIEEFIIRGKTFIKKNPKTKLQEAMEKIQKAADNPKQTKLDLQATDITEIPEKVFEMTKIKFLTLSNNKIKSIPNNIGKLINLEYLFLGDNPITEIPDEVGSLTNLIILSIPSLEIKDFPDSLNNLENLQEIYLDYDKLDKFPQFLKQLPKLKKIHFSHCFSGSEKKLSSFINDITQCKTLKNIIFYHGNKKTIPEAKVNKITEILPKAKVELQYIS